MRGNLHRVCRVGASLGPIPACAGQPTRNIMDVAVFRAYPRVCGATVHGLFSFSEQSGLSPRVRGNPEASVFSGPSEGPIPACAGQPVYYDRVSALNAAYPRVCGATFFVWNEQSCREGLSPRVRGNQGHGHQHAALRGPIPACAGQPNGNKMLRFPDRAYPRVCGATGCCQGSSCQIQGLSPRVRGNPFRATDKETGEGPIPACAGQPLQTHSWPLSRWAYPRVCGATSCGYACCNVARGLSPRVRGNLNKLNALSLCLRPIPACAGQPELQQDAGDFDGAYPRVCGATGGGGSTPATGGGLSPRVRGNRLRLRRSMHALRPIPACAGQPSCRSARRGAPGAYPRVCGATLTVLSSMTIWKGLSPRVRGNRRRRPSK